MKKIALIIILLACSFQSQAQWQYRMNLETDGDVLDDAIFCSQNLGFYWTTWGDIHNASYRLYRTEDGWNTSEMIEYKFGSDWAKPSLISITFLNDTIGYRIAGTSYEQLEKTIDKGDSWTILNDQSDIWSAEAMSFPSIDTGYLLVDDGSFRNFTIVSWYNEIFKIIDCPIYKYYNQIHFTDVSTGFVFCKDSINPIYYCLRTADSANTWTPVLESQNLDFRALSFPSREVGYVLARGGILYKTIDAGINWQALNIGVTSTMNSMYFINDTLGYIAGNSGLILKTRNGGNSWITENSGITTPIQKIYMSDTTQGFFLSGVKVYGRSLVGVSDHYSPEFFIYPNPAHEYIHVSFLNSDSPAKLSIYSLDGLKVFELENYISGESIYTGDLLKGVYILSITDKKGTGNRKFIKE
jgi:photosystem II stability/assembly factor-like uncharacterized protein